MNIDHDKINNEECYSNIKVEFQSFIYSWI